MKRANLCLTITFCLFLSACSSLRPKEVGLLEGKLRPCPPAPKCVSSYYTDGIHAVDPLTYTGSKKDAYQRLLKVIEQIPRAEIVRRDPDYIYVQVKVTSVDWIDDVEFLIDDEEKVIHFSSSASSPVGFWDWGENRRRAKMIHRLFQEIGPKK